MKSISKYIDYFKADLDLAEQYVQVANIAKVEGSTKEFENALKIATDNIAHALSWHDIIVEAITEAKEDMKERNITVPEYMKYVWEKDHEYFVKKVSELKYEIDLLKRMG